MVSFVSLNLRPHARQYGKLWYCVFCRMQKAIRSLPDTQTTDSRSLFRNVSVQCLNDNLFRICLSARECESVCMCLCVHVYSCKHKCSPSACAQNHSTPSPFYDHGQQPDRWSCRATTTPASSRSPSSLSPSPSPSPRCIKYAPETLVTPFTMCARERSASARSRRKCDLHRAMRFAPTEIITQPARNSLRD